MFFAYKVFISSNGDILEPKNLSDDFKIVGSLQYDLCLQQKKASFYNLNINPDYQRKGFAKKLRAYVIQKLLNDCVTTFETSPKSTNPHFSTKDLISFYIRQFEGFGCKEVIHSNNKITFLF